MGKTFDGHGRSRVADADRKEIPARAGISLPCRLRGGANSPTSWRYGRAIALNVKQTNMIPPSSKPIRRVVFTSSMRPYPEDPVEKNPSPKSDATHEPRGGSRFSSLPFPRHGKRARRPQGSCRRLRTDGLSQKTSPGENGRGPSLPSEAVRDPWGAAGCWTGIRCRANANDPHHVPKSAPLL